ncbi:MAG: protein kinase [Actinomycetota bacterium]|nr:protein kinase [Actinomycetota bacterium]
MADSPRIDAERVLAGRYRLRRPIARGGMAEVWEATDHILGRPVAVKVLLPHLAVDQSFLERFRREAIAAARLAHPNVVATFDTGVDDGVAYIVMELVHGRTLHQVLAAQGALSPHRAMRIAVQVAAALDYAHEHGVVHRDVKPGNILVGDDERVKVADFGIAKAAVAPGAEGKPWASQDLTQSGAVVGTAKYLSPEQVNGDPIDGRADIYSLGVVLYEMLCGRAPFAGETDVAVALQHVTASPLSPRQVRSGIPRSLEAVVLRALSKSPDDRYATAADMESALVSVDLGPDDAVPLVVRDPTPPEGTPALSFRESERSWLYPVGLIVAAAVALGIIGVLFARTDTGQRLLNGNGNSGATRTLTVARAQSFDPPPGSQAEHDDELPLLFDGDQSTAWTTETYSTSRFGRLKEGVGMVAVLSGAGRLDELEVTSASEGWSARVYVADGPKATLAEWGEPVASKNGIGDGSTTFSLEGRQGAAILLWITDLGPANQVGVAEVKVTGS